MKETEGNRFFTPIYSLKHVYCPVKDITNSNVGSCVWVSGLTGRNSTYVWTFLTSRCYTGQKREVCGDTVNEKANSLDSTSQLPHTTSVLHIR